MLACMQAGDGHGNVPMSGCSDGDSVHIFELENLAKVLVGRGRIAERLLRVLSKPGEDVAIHIANVGDAGGFLVGLERGEMGIGTLVQANDCKVEAIVGPENLAVALSAGADRQARCSDCNCIEKLPTS